MYKHLSFEQFWQSLKLPGGHKHPVTSSSSVEEQSHFIQDIGSDPERLASRLPNVSTDDVLKVLHKYRADIVDKVSDPHRLAEQLHSNDLITGAVARDILTTQGISDYRKACIVMNDVERNLSVGNAVQKFAILCEILKRLFTGDCKMIIEEMEREIIS